MLELGAELTVEKLQEAADIGKEKVYEFYLAYRQASLVKLEDLRRLRSEFKTNASTAAKQPYNTHTVLFFKETARLVNQAVQDIKQNIEGCDRTILADIDNVLAEAARIQEGPQRMRDPFEAEPEELSSPRPG